MAVRSVAVINDSNEVVATQVVNTEVSVINRVVEVLPSTTITAGVVLPVVGQNIVQNAIVSATPPVNPYEGQVWIDIS